MIGAFSHACGRHKRDKIRAYFRRRLFVIAFPKALRALAAQFARMDVKRVLHA